MSIIAVNPLILKDVTLEIGTDDYKKHVSKVSFTPSASSVTWKGLGGNTHTDVTNATWTCELSYVQDWETTDSLSAYLYANEGSTVAVNFKPRTGSGPSFTANIVITPGAIGGAVDAYTDTSVTLGCDGKPVLVPAV